MDGSASLGRIREYVDRHRERLATPGLALAVTDRDRCLGVVADGVADVAAGTQLEPHHRFQIGSISKGFTALAVLQEVERGRMRLAAPVTEYLPWFEVRSSFGPITLHHLLSHTGGLVTGSDFTGSAVSEVWSLRDTETGFAPGERFLYSNVGYKAVGLCLESVTGEPWWRTVRAQAMEPIGMGGADVIISEEARPRLATGHRSPTPDRRWLPRHGWGSSPWFESDTADGTICATAEELTAYARLLLASGAGVVSPASFEAMTTPVLPDDLGQGYGYGLRRVRGDGRSLLGHSGGMVGFSTQLLVDPSSGFGATTLTNSVYGATFDPCVFALRCLAAEAAGEVLPEIPEPPDPYRIDGAGAFAGRYADGTSEIEVVARDGGLTVEEGGRSGRLRGEDGVFVVDDPVLERFPIRFVLEGGVVVGAHWGPRWLRHERAADASEPDHPGEWTRYPGRYVTWNPWFPGFHVFLRRGELWLAVSGEASDVEGERPMFPLPDGSFRVGEPWSPDRVRFDMVIDGLAHRAVFDGAPAYRSFVP
ncbi:MAG TPA: serine hydrolase domain-containing protein [Actinomycetota bacterium]